IDIRSEYFELMPLPKQDYPLLSSWFRRKYPGRKFDVVVAVGTTALGFVREYHEKMFKDAQIVYWGNSAALDNWRSGPAVTGLLCPQPDTHPTPPPSFNPHLPPAL